MRRLIICISLLASLTAFSAEKKSSKKATAAKTAETTAAPAETKKNEGLIGQASGQGYGTAGCGLGSLLFGQKEGMVQIFATTTNGISGNQTFGISTGTLNCDAGMAKSQHAALTRFFAANEAVIDKDMARGQGESINVIGSIMGCKDNSALGTELQRNYGSIYEQGKVAPEALSQRVLGVINNNAELANACKLAI